MDRTGHDAGREISGMPSKVTLSAAVAIVAAILLLAGGFAAGYGLREGPVVVRTEGGGSAPETFRFENPVAKVERDEWAVYRLSDNKTLHYEVRGYNPLTWEVTILEEQRDDELNKVLTSRETRIDPNHFLTGLGGSRVVNLYPQSIRAGGREWDCLCIETVASHTGLIRSWFSTEVPVLGMVKRERGGRGPHAGLVLAELLDWSGR
jgi:hypothetical protein